MTKLDFGNLPKFIASIGIALILASALGPWFFYQSTGVLTLSQSSLSSLTTPGRDSLLARQRTIQEVQHLLLWFALGVFVIGVAVLVWGVVMWWPEHSANQAKLKKDKADLEVATTSEREEKAKEDLADAVTESRSPAPAEGELTGAVDAPTASPKNTELEVAYRRRLQEAALFERRGVELLREAYGGDFNVAKNVKVRNDEAIGYVFDAVVNPPQRTSWAQLAVEFRAIPSRSLPLRLSKIMVELAVAARQLGGGMVYTGKRGRPVQAQTTAVVICLVDGDWPKVEERVFAYVRGVNAVLRNHVGVILCSEERWSTLNGSDLRDAISPLWAGQDTGFQVLD